MLSTQLKNDIQEEIIGLFRANISDDKIIPFFAAIRAGYNTIDGFQLPSIGAVQNFSSELTNTVNNILNHHKKLTPEQFLEFNELLKQNLCGLENMYRDIRPDEYNNIKNAIATEANSLIQKHLNASMNYSSSTSSKKNTSYSYQPIFTSNYVPYTPWYYTSPVTIVNNTVSGAVNNSQNKRDDRDDKASIFAIILAIVAFAGIISAGVLSAIYAINKGYKSAVNLASGNKLIRSACRIAAIGAGMYFGLIVGAIAGASLGSIVPGLGEIAGGIIGSVFSAGIGAAFGAFVSKQVGRLASWLQTGETNPEKWSLSSDQDDKLIALGFTRQSINEIERLIKAIQPVKKEATSEQKTKYNHLLHMLKNGEVTGRFMLDNNFYNIDAPIKRPTNPLNFLYSKQSPSQQPAFNPEHQKQTNNIVLYPVISEPNNNNDTPPPYYSFGK